MDAIAKLAEEEAKAGTMLGSGGLGPTALGARVRLSGGQVTVTDGPFTEAKEVVGGYAQFELKSKEEAVESAVRFMELHKKHWPGWEGETEVRQMFGPEDFAPAAPDAKWRVPSAACSRNRSGHDGAWVHRSSYHGERWHGCASTACCADGLKMV